VLAGGGATGNNSASAGPVGECDFGFDGWIAAGIENLTGVDISDIRYGHECVLCWFTRLAIINEPDDMLGDASTVTMFARSPKSN
jgi:hypothetical protein